MKTILRTLHPIKGFIYRSTKLLPAEGSGPPSLEVRVKRREGSHGVCSSCGKKAPGYDRQPERRWSFVPLWAMSVFLVCAPQRVDCRRCGPTIEKLPWASGKHQNCDVFRLFLTKWARLLPGRKLPPVSGLRGPMSIRPSNGSLSSALKTGTSPGSQLWESSSGGFGVLACGRILD